ncbi:aspartate aminotransferase family protein [Pseudohalioglobus sediminis]|uniref:Aspartate aminotransferase family protein n=1 Tax=Pseudohalioglobus sediminis TaxID=2606449 RepID=A0A5B0X266_9GAMM|nr:aspartate aminotransferase family protein [Pseudohalioglobus sediminis]KAA1193464.1 aspartate aminotransferase family protein [Pseudohalioglobus sediminis]
MKFPQQGRSPDDILSSLKARKQDDVPWEEGRVFAYIYDAGDEAEKLLKDAFSLYLMENGLDPTSFPSCMELEKEVIGMAVDLVNGGDDATGTFTSGGTESILLSLKTTRDYYRDIRPDITEPEILMATTAHPAFHKACQYFDLKAVTVDVDDDFCAIPEAMEAAITENTILMVGSAPSYAHGAIDPITELGQIALRHQLRFHVDCCVGGMYLPFAKELGYDIPEFDLSVPGVTQLSMDFHKWGYAAKGASCILYKDRAIRRYQIFSYANWTGYAVINPGVTSTKGGGPIAACWAILNYIGREGYLRLVKASQEASAKIVDAVERIDGLEMMGKAQINMLAIRATDFNIFPVADEMKARGWFIQPQFGFANSSENMHLSVGYHNAHQVDEFVRDLAEVVAAVRAEQRDKEPFVMPDDLREFIVNSGPEVMDHLSEVLGSDGSALPGKMEEINNMLNQLPADSREMLLGEFINRLYNPDVH